MKVGTNISIGRAAGEDIILAEKQAEDIFCREQGIPRELCPLPESKRPCWWCAKWDGRIIGTAASYWEEDVCHVGRFTIVREFRGMHIGAKLLRFVIEDLLAEEADEVFMEARETTVHMMKKLGAVVVGEAVPFYKGTVTPLVLKKENFKSRS